MDSVSLTQQIFDDNLTFKSFRSGVTEKREWSLVDLVTRSFSIYNSVLLKEKTYTFICSYPFIYLHVVYYMQSLIFKRSRHS